MHFGEYGVAKPNHIFTKKEKTIGIQLTKEKDFDHQRVNLATFNKINKIYKFNTCLLLFMLLE